MNSEQEEVIEVFKMLTNSNSDDARYCLQKYNWDLNSAVNHFIEFGPVEIGTRNVVDLTNGDFPMVGSHPTSFPASAPEANRSNVEEGDTMEESNPAGDPSSGGRAAEVEEYLPEAVLVGESTVDHRLRKRRVVRFQGQRIEGDGAPAADTDTSKQEEQFVNDEMLKAAIAASREEGTSTGGPVTNETRNGSVRREEDEEGDMARALALSIQTAELDSKRRTAVGEAASGGGMVGEEGADSHSLLNSTEQQQGSGAVDVPLSEPVGLVEPGLLAPEQRGMGRRSGLQGQFEEEEVAGVSVEEQEEARMIEAAMFGLPYVARHERVHSAFAFPSGAALAEDEGLLRPRRRGPAPAAHPLAQAAVEEQRSVRTEQDIALSESLAADREKEQRALQEQRERDVREREGRERRAREEQEREDRERALQAALAAKRALLPAEPSASEEGVVAVMVRMPQGAKTRRFRKTDSIQSLFDFLEVEGDALPGRYSLVQAFSKRLFTGDTPDSQRSFQELGLDKKQEALVMRLSP